MSMNLIERKKRIAGLFGLSVEQVPDDYDIEMLNSFHAKRRPQLLAYTLDELEAMEDPDFILPGWVPNGLTVVYAKPKGGKTFWVMTLSVCYAAGIPFFGMPLNGTGRVLYIASEGSGKATWRRIGRIAKSLGVDMAELRDRIKVVTTGVKVDRPDSVLDLLLLNPGTWDMVVIDTLARCMEGDESNTRDMNEAVNGLDTIRREMKSASMIVVHHEGWEKERLRGSIALFGALDGQIHVTRKDGLNFVQIQELREAAVPEDDVMTFRLDREAGALVLTPQQPKGVEKLTQREDKMFDVLGRLCTETGARSVDEKAWRDAVKAEPIIIAKSETNWRTMWGRAVRHMAEVGTIKIETDGTISPWRASDDFPDDID
jgi:hypothetical protein